MKKIILLGGAIFALFFTLSVQAGTFWFPLEGYYPYDVDVTAVPDLDQRVGYVQSRLGETGKKSNGCLPYTAKYPCTSPYKKDYSVWGYLKDGGGDWEYDGINYTDKYPEYFWYDNHSGYDFLGIPNKTNVRTVEKGTFCGYTVKYGQICVEHISGNKKTTYRTYYTHMKGIPASISTMKIGTKIPKWTKIGVLSDEGVPGAFHLHFSVYKYDPKNPNLDKRESPLQDWIVVDPYGIKDGLGGRDLEPYLWN